MVWGVGFLVNTGFLKCDSVPRCTDIGDSFRRQNAQACEGEEKECETHGHRKRERGCNARVRNVIPRQGGVIITVKGK